MEGLILGNQKPQMHIEDVVGDVVVVAAEAMLVAEVVATGIEVGGTVDDFFFLFFFSFFFFFVYYIS